MSNKIQKLREVNQQLDTVLKELEVKMFIDNISDAKDNKSKSEQPKVVMEIK